VIPDARTLRAFRGHFESPPATAEASLAAQRAFNVWRGDKTSHAPLTLVRAAPGKPWLRIQGFVTPSELLQLPRSARTPRAVDGIEALRESCRSSTTRQKENRIP
jgi:hypothetical protein